MRRIADLKSKLQRTNPVEHATEYNRMFGELVALEQHRRTLREQAIGGERVSRLFERGTDAARADVVERAGWAAGSGCSPHADARRLLAAGHPRRAGGRASRPTRSGAAVGARRDRPTGTATPSASGSRRSAEFGQVRPVHAFTSWTTRDGCCQHGPRAGHRQRPDPAPGHRPRHARPLVIARRPPRGAARSAGRASSTRASTPTTRPSGSSPNARCATAQEELGTGPPTDLATTRRPC